MAVLQIRPAQREGARLLLGLGGVSGSGKTRTAIELAYGMANYDAGKVGFLDTENRRGSLYADALVNNPTHPTKTPFLIGDLVAPHSPSRYVEAIREFQAAGVEVLIVDSASHEWEGTGGCIEIAESNVKMPAWNKAKSEHKRFINALLQCDMHVIVCVRAREKATPERNADGKLIYRELGLQPITEKNMMFEMTASLMVHDQGLRQEVVKCPGDLQASLGRGKGYLTAEDGKAIRDWVDGGKTLDPKVEQFRNRLLSAAEEGEKHIDDCWKKTPAAIREALGDGFHSQIVQAAVAYDLQRAAEAEGDEPQAPNTGSAIMAAAAAAPAVTKAAPVQEAPPAAVASTPVAEPVAAAQVTPAAAEATPAAAAAADIDDEDPF